MAVTGEADMPVALALRALGLGDVLTAVPALGALRRALPDHRLVLLAPRRWGRLVSLIDAVDGLAPAEGLHGPLTAARGPVDIAVNLHGKGPQSHAALAALRPRHMAGYACAPWIEPGPAAPPWNSGVHERRRWCLLIEAAFGVSADPDDVAIRAPGGEPGAGGEPEAGGQYALLHPGAASGSRRWPVPRFAQVGRWLADHGLRIVVSAGPGEADLGSALAGAIGCAAVCVRPDDAIELASTVAGARLVVCGDTGVAHLASALRRPSVVLFGPVSPELWGPPTRGPHSVLWHGDGHGDPHADGVDAALLRIDAEEVIAACAERLRDADC